jgi:3-methyladenine DNA glycosylase Tag
MTPNQAKSLANDVACAIATLQAVADELMTAYPDSDYDRDEPEREATTPEPPKARTVTLDEVRSALSAKAANGKREEVKALLGKYGAAQLSAVKPEHYAELLKDAEGL